jgi:VIT1/CCC1 family predicted Fe2+/Mn2+ transporter
MTGRGRPAVRGAITGAGTFTGGIVHTLPFLISHYHGALVAASVVVACELVALAWIRFRFLETSFLVSVAHITLGGAVIVAVSVALGTTG